MTELRKKAVQHEFFPVPKRRIMLVRAVLAEYGRCRMGTMSRQSWLNMAEDH